MKLLHSGAWLRNGHSAGHSIHRQQLASARPSDASVTTETGRSLWSLLLFAATLLLPLSAHAEDDIVVTAGEKVQLFSDYDRTTTTWTFDDGTLQGWTTIDSDGDGYSWMSSDYINPGKQGHNNTECVISHSYITEAGALTPSNYLVAPTKITATKDTYISFFAAAQDKTDNKEHFGVAVKIHSNKYAYDFRIIASWTTEDRQWREYKVDLSNYAGQEIWVAICHFNCTNQYVLKVDDIKISNYTTDSRLSTTWTFDDGTLQGWTTIDADGDGYNWRYPGGGKLRSESLSTDEWIGLTPDNYLVAPIKIAATEKTYISFDAVSEFVINGKEHFGVAVSTKSNTNPDDFETIAEWTTPDDKQWREYQVDLSRYAGKNIWVALRHFDCYNQYRLLVDNITIGKDSSQEGYAEWTCDNSSIGLSDSGDGTVEFVALNDASGKDQVAHITKKPYSFIDGEKVYNGNETFTITVKPLSATVMPIDDIHVKSGEAVEVDFDVSVLSNLYYCFYNGTLQGWTTIDADGDGYTWNPLSSSVYSESYTEEEWIGLTPDNYLVSPIKIAATEKTYISFDATHKGSVEENSKEHFGVAVSTKSNTNPDDFETIAEWTTPPQDRQWREYKVDLSKYAGKNIWVALRHFDCYRQRWILVDNIKIANIMSDEEMKCKWVNDSPSMGLAAAGEGNINFNAINIYAEDLVANITVNAYKDVDGGKAYGRPMTFKVIVAAKETAIEQITTDDSNAEYYNVNGVRVPAARLVPGIYIRRNGDKFDKVLVK